MSISKEDYMRDWRKRNKDKVRGYSQKFRQNHPKEWNEFQRKCSKKRRGILRTKILALLGGQCANPYDLHDKSFTDIRCLQVDHLNREAKHREKKNGQATDGSEMYLRTILKEIQLGSKDYQLLCANCNWIKRFENKENGGYRKVYIRESPQSTCE